MVTAGRFWPERHLNFSLCELKAKAQLYQVRNSLGLGVQMPHCTPLSMLLQVRKP